MGKLIQPAPVLTERTIARFWARVNKTPGQGPTKECWTLHRRGWHRNREPSSKPKYGKINIRDVTYSSHRLSHFIITGDWPPEVCHSCDWKPCCNPAHLWSGDSKANMEDAATKGRMSSGDRHYARTRPDLLNRGEAHPAAKLTTSQVKEAARLRASGWTYRAIRDAINPRLHLSTIPHALSKNWSHLRC